MVPPLPTGLRMDETVEFAFTVYQAIPILVIGFLAVRAARRERDALPVLFLVGGALCVLIEPIVDVLGLCYFPVEGQRWTLVQAFDRHVPLFVGEA